MPYLLLVLTTLFWSGNFVISRGMHAAIPPLALSFWRWALAFSILAFFGLRHLRAERQLAMQHKKFLIIQGLLGVAGFNSFIYYAMQTTTAINAALVNSCTPIIIVLISWARFKDRLSLRQCLGVAVSLGGVLLIISRGDLTTLLHLQFNHGDLLVFIAACLWSFYSVNLKKYPRGLHPLAYQTAIAMVGLTTLLPLYLLEIASGKTMEISSSTVVTIVYVAVFASVLAFIFWNRAVSTLGANIAGPFIHLMPAFSTILAVFFLGETLTKNHMMAILLIFGGIFMTTFRVKRKQKFIKTLSICLMVTGIFSHQPSQAGAGETLLGFAEAWQKISEENDTLAAAKANLDQARHKKDAARDLYLPEVELSANYMRLDDEVTLSPNDILASMPAGNRLAPLLEGVGRSYGLSGSALNAAFTSTIAERNNRSGSLRGSWPIYAGGRIDAAQDIARGQEKEADQKFEMSRQEQFDNVARYYFTAVLARQVCNVKVELEDGLKQHFHHALLLEQQGQIAKVERIQAEAAYDKAKVERHKAARDLEIAGIALTRMLKSSETVTPTDALFITDRLPPLETFLEQTLAGSPGLTILKAKQDQATGLIAVEEGKYYPTIALFGSYSLYEEDDLASKMLPDWILGIGLKLPFLDRSGRSGNVGAAKSMVRQLEYLQSQTRSDLSVLVEKTYRQAEQAIEEFHGLVSSLHLAEETVSLRSKSFQQGLSTSLDVVDAEMFLAGVKIQRSAAAYSYVITLAKLLAVSGQMETFFSYQIPQAR